MPGPLSSTVTRKTSSEIFFTWTRISGTPWASSHASRALSTASFTVVMIPLVGESKPSRCLFFSKNSAMLMARCFRASSSARDTGGHLGHGVREREGLLLAGPEVFQGHRPGLHLPLPEDRHVIRGPRRVGDLGPQIPVEEVDLDGNPPVPEGLCHFEGPDPSLLGRAHRDPDGPGHLHLAEGDHEPVEADGKAAGGDVVSAEEVGEPVGTAPEHLVLGTEVRGKPLEDHTGVVVQSPRDSEIKGVHEMVLLEDLHGLLDPPP